MEKSEKAKRIIQNHALYASGAGYIPVPVVDHLGVTALQVKMMKELADHHEDHTFRTSWIKTAISTILTSYFGKRAGISFASLFKVVPVVGPLLGGASMAISHGAITYALGHTINNHLESGGTLENLDLKGATTHFGAIFRKKQAEEAGTSATEVEVEAATA